MKLKPDEVLYVQGGLGCFHKVTAVFTDPDAANAYLANASAEAVLSVFAGIIFIAACDDLGLLLPSLSSI
jgi:hypothetical protein